MRGHGPGRVWCDANNAPAPSAFAPVKHLCQGGALYRCTATSGAGRWAGRARAAAAWSSSCAWTASCARSTGTTAPTGAPVPASVLQGCRSAGGTGGRSRPSGGLAGLSDTCALLATHVRPVDARAWVGGPGRRGGQHLLCHGAAWPCVSVMAAVQAVACGLRVR